MMKTILRPIKGAVHYILLAVLGGMAIGIGLGDALRRGSEKLRGIDRQLTGRGGLERVAMVDVKVICPESLLVREHRYTI